MFNRRFLEESLERELQIASRKKQAAAVLFLDLDHFKRFNDTVGHDTEDMVLQSLADLFRTFFRATDICCRYGGEQSPSFCQSHLRKMRLSVRMRCAPR